MDAESDTLSPSLYLFTVDQFVVNFSHMLYGPIFYSCILYVHVLSMIVCLHVLLLIPHCML